MLEDKNKAKNTGPEDKDEDEDLTLSSATIRRYCNQNSQQIR